MGEAAYRVLVIGRNRLAARSLHGAVRIEPDQPDRKQLHDLARVVFVGADVGVEIRLAVLEHRQVVAHDRTQGHVFEQVAVVAEGAVDEQVVVVGHRDRIAFDGAALVRNDEQLTEREGNTLAQLIRCGDGVQPPGFLATVLVDLEAGGSLRLEIGPVMRCRQAGLVCEPCVVADRAQAGDFGAARAERGLSQEARGFGIGIGALGAVIEAGIEDVIAGPDLRSRAE